MKFFSIHSITETSSFSDFASLRILQISPFMRYQYGKFTVEVKYDKSIQLSGQDGVLFNTSYYLDDRDIIAHFSLSIRRLNDFLLSELGKDCDKYLSKFRRAIRGYEKSDFLEHSPIRYRIVLGNSPKEVHFDLWYSISKDLYVIRISSSQGARWTHTDSTVAGLFYEYTKTGSQVLKDILDARLLGNM